MIAAADFSLCIRKPESCSRHANCARAQLGSRNPQRQSFIAPQPTGDACSLFFDFAPFRQLAANGGGIADQLSVGNGVSAGVGRAGGVGLASSSGSDLDANEREQLHAARALKL